MPESKTNSNMTPMMRQYSVIKEKNPDTVLLYRMGDFYEMFNEDAKIASKVLGLTLTSRSHGKADNIPLAGFPYHALDRYANRFVRAGYKIAICEQVEDPKKAKGIVKRDIVEIITAGTATEDNYIEENSNNYIVAISGLKSNIDKTGNEKYGLAVCDLSTGEFFVEEILPNKLEEEITRIDPSEVLLQDDVNDEITKWFSNFFSKIYQSKIDSWKFDIDHAQEVLESHFNVASLDGMGLEDFSIGIGSAGALLSYLKEQKKNDLKHITSLTPRRITEFAELDPATIRNLELLRPLQTGETGGTLISVIDKSNTSMGARLIRKWITHPLQDIIGIERRLDCVEWLKNDVFVRSELQLMLKSISDIERLIGRVTFERANARDLVSLKESLKIFPQIINAISKTKCEQIKEISLAISGFDELVNTIDKVISDAPPLSIKDGGIIKSGISKELDEIRDASINGKKWIAGLQASEKERTGISSLKIGFNKVFGYYIEVSKANLSDVPDNYIRKQTLVNAERFITEELKEKESKILGAEERLSAMEYEIFVNLRKDIATSCDKIQKASESIAILDVFVSLARVASEYKYCRPTLTTNTDFKIYEGRHPVVERMEESNDFVSNDAEFNSEERQILLITGPNMAGKSTYLRQNALIALMAQIGSFVPATSAHIGVVDKFFTRVGASDRLARGQSTFLVEMIEVANILNNATDKSLVLLDEVGRGTSTFDGVSIAWAVAEYLHNSKGRKARTFFATHYHELTELAMLFPRIKNIHIKVKEWNDQIIFLRKIGEGSCDHSYGIQVARLAGVPKPVITRAKEILSNLENMELTPDHKPLLARHQDTNNFPEKQKNNDGMQLNLLDTNGIELVQQLKDLKIDGLTPLDALNLLFSLQKKALDTQL